jgi:hypothetical protein
MPLEAIAQRVMPVPLPAPEPAPAAAAEPAVAGVALLPPIGAFGTFGMGPGLGRRTSSRAPSDTLPPTTGSPHAWPVASADASAAAQTQLVAALQRQVDALDAVPSADSGRCRAAEAQRLHCDHAWADAALGEAGAGIATLLHTLAAIDQRLLQPGLAYADGRFRVELR